MNVKLEIAGFITFSDDNGFPRIPSTEEAHHFYRVYAHEINELEHRLSMLAGAMCKENPTHWSTLPIKTIKTKSLEMPTIIGLQ